MFAKTFNSVLVWMLAWQLCTLPGLDLGRLGLKRASQDEAQDGLTLIGWPVGPC